MKILLTNYRYFVSGGPERYMFNVKTELEKKGHTLVPFSITYTANQNSAYAKYFVPPIGDKDQVYFHEHKMASKALIKTLARLFYSKEVEKNVSHLIEETRPQAAYILHYLRKLSPSLLVGIKKHKLPIVVRLSDFAMVCPQTHCIKKGLPCTLCSEGNLLPSVRYRCVKDSLAASMLNLAATMFHRTKGYFELIDQFVVTNSFMYEIMRNAGWPAGKLSCVPTFTDTSCFTPAPAVKTPPYICFSGRLEEIKGAHILIDAFARLKHEIKNGLKLKIAGQGQSSYLAALKARVEALRLQASVEFTGRLDTPALSRLLAGAQLSVVPSLWFENLPNTILESYACGTPVIASDIGSLSECIKPGLTGDLFCPGDSLDLAEKLSAYLHKTSQLNTMGKNARTEALTRYSSASHIKKLEQIFYGFN